MTTEKNQIESLPPVLFFLVRNVGEYRVGTRWGSFDTLNVRALQDLYFDPGPSKRVIYGFTAEPPHGQDIKLVSLPTQLALEQVFSHLSEPSELVLNPRNGCPGASIPQSELVFSVPDDFDPTVILNRDDLPRIIGGLLSSDKSDRLSACHAAFKRGSHFECYYLANQERQRDSTNKKAWFYELFAFSFFGSADRALTLYESYPGQGASDSMSQLLAARYRLLLRQLNEARTILHTLSFNPEWGAIASSELARSYLIDKQYSRAFDAASSALKNDPDLSDAYLLRGSAIRAIAYEAGDSDSLKEAYSDFEKIAKLGGYHAAEAIYHAGTILARLGALSESETAFKQSLFQRDRVTARDALIRVLCARGHGSEAQAEMNKLEKLVPNYGAKLRAELGSALTSNDSESVADTLTRVNRESSESFTEVREFSELWGTDLKSSVVAARALLSVWEIPFSADLLDCALIDDLINRFAPDGDFPKEGRFAALSRAGHDVLARAFALHVGDVLSSNGGGVLEANNSGQRVLQLQRNGVTIPIENFIRDRILLGASGDNFSSLESLALELAIPDSMRLNTRHNSWWELASDLRSASFDSEVRWVREKLTELGVALGDSLEDFEILDRWVDATFEPGGAIKDGISWDSELQVDRLTTGIGLFIGQRIARVVSAKWYDHDKPEGISLWNDDLGRVFPVARAQRRIYLASAADFSAKFGGLAWSLAVASATEGVRQGRLVGHEAVKGALLELLPSIGQFPEIELSGVVDSLLLIR